MLKQSNQRTRNTRFPLQMVVVLYPHQTQGVIGLEHDVTPWNYLEKERKKNLQRYEEREEIDYRWLLCQVVHVAGIPFNAVNNIEQYA